MPRPAPRGARRPPRGTRRCTRASAASAPTAAKTAVEAPMELWPAPRSSAFAKFPRVPAATRSAKPMPLPKRRQTLPAKRVAARTLPRTWPASAWSVSAVTARHHWPARISEERALPRANQALPPSRGPVTAKKPRSAPERAARGSHGNGASGSGSGSGSRRFSRSQVGEQLAGPRRVSGGRLEEPALAPAADLGREALRLEHERPVVGLALAARDGDDHGFVRAHRSSRPAGPASKAASRPRSRRARWAPTRRSARTASPASRASQRESCRAT